MKMLFLFLLPYCYPLALALLSSEAEES